MPLNSAFAAQPIHRHINDNGPYGVSFDLALDEGETLTGTPTVTATPSGLTFSNVAVNAEEFSYRGVAIPAGKGVVFRVTGGARRTTYELDVRATRSDGLPANGFVKLIDD